MLPSVKLRLVSLSLYFKQSQHFISFGVNSKNENSFFHSSLILCNEREVNVNKKGRGSDQLVDFTIVSMENLGTITVFQPLLYLSVMF